ncbi:hypothetical protein WQQ_30460 [Hydrocarboniphaga effusa AP103]|uniref:Uncharacterized protein n=1 Tax=Hydrocarboniphaga effusa AP103 TaxID=1172194 RepID=I7ZC93_9GAMM|nr:hypothetical protein WQQ_30460 [Hydrocarboniphaga effusa AP103]
MRFRSLPNQLGLRDLGLFRYLRFVHSCLLACSFQDRLTLSHTRDRVLCDGDLCFQLVQRFVVAIQKGGFSLGFKWGETFGFSGDVGAQLLQLCSAVGSGFFK